MKIRWRFVGWIVVALLFVFLLQGVIDQVILTPAYLLWWRLKYWIQYPAQLIYWLALVLVVGIAGWIFFLKSIQPPRAKKSKKKPGLSPVLEVATEISEAKTRGHYYKWRLSRRFAELAKEILAFRENESVSVRRTLGGRYWHPPQKLEKYFAAGARPSTESPVRRKFGIMKFREDPDLDLDPGYVIAYLEELMEEENG